MTIFKKSFQRLSSQQPNSQEKKLLHTYVMCINYTFITWRFWSNSKNINNLHELFKLDKFGRIAGFLTTEYSIVANIIIMVRKIFDNMISRMQSIPHDMKYISITVDFKAITGPSFLSVFAHVMLVQLEKHNSGSSNWATRKEVKLARFAWIWALNFLVKYLCLRDVNERGKGQTTTRQGTGKLSSNSNSVVILKKKFTIFGHCQQRSLDLSPVSYRKHHFIYANMSVNIFYYSSSPGVKASLRPYRPGCSDIGCLNSELPRDQPLVSE